MNPTERDFSTADLVDGALAVLDQGVWADGGYTGGLVTWARTVARIEIEIVQRNEAHTFVVLPRRWVVERTFAWLVKCRRIGWDYERLPETSEALVHWAMPHASHPGLRHEFKTRS